MDGQILHNRKEEKLRSEELRERERSKSGPAPPSPGNPSCQSTERGHQPGHDIKEQSRSPGASPGHRSAQPPLLFIKP